MKFIKWKILMVTSFVTLSPILLGLAMWSNLPDTMAIHFDFYGNPDNFASKGFVVFALPVLMLATQILCSVIIDVQARKFGNIRKPEIVVKWIVPVMSVVLQIVTIGFSLGWNVDIRKVVCFLVGGIFVITGNYMPKFNYVKHYKMETQKARKINRFVGILSVIMGVLFIISVFLPPFVSVICLLLMIPYTIISIIYGIKVRKN